MENKRSTQNRQRVLLTGHNGYIGSVMAPLLAQAGHDVVGLDSGYYSACSLPYTPFPGAPSIPWVRKDLRSVELSDLKGFDAVIHLGALSNDPIGNMNEQWTEEINHHSSVQLAELAKKAGVRRFIFSSSCIMYGMSEAEVVNEDSPLDPKTEYARSKVKSERAITQLASDDFAPTFLRNGTIYGPSPRMRFDTVLNDLVGSAATTGKVVLFSDGKPWRPVVHVEDVSRYFLTVLEAPLADVWNQAFNAGANHLNHQIIELAQIVTDVVEGCKLEVLANPGADQRTYKADFSKFARVFPDFSFKWSAKEGARDLYEIFKRIGLTHEQFVDKRFTRLKWIQHLLKSEQVDASLRWRETAAAPAMAGASND
jgi:nucleoside-diphosphate-sugar epimerase